MTPPPYIHIYSIFDIEISRKTPPLSSHTYFVLGPPPLLHFISMVLIGYGFVSIHSLRLFVVSGFTSAHAYPLGQCVFMRHVREAVCDEAAARVSHRGSHDRCPTRVQVMWGQVQVRVLPR